MSSGGADALLKGMLGIGISKETATTAPSTAAGDNSGGNKAADQGKHSTNKHKKKKPHQKTSSKLRSGSQGRRGSEQGAGGDVDKAAAHEGAEKPGDSKTTTAADQKKGSASKKKKKKGAHGNKGGGAGGGRQHEEDRPAGKTDAKVSNANASTPKAEQLERAHSKFSSSKHNAANYAWSAFQSSPDPSALPDIGGLFDDDAGKDGGGGLTTQDGSSRGEVGRNDDDDGGDALVAGPDVFDEEVAARGAGSSLNLGPPSGSIRGSLVDSMMAKKGMNPALVKSMMAKKKVNPGEELLQRLTSSPEKRRASSSENSPAIVAGGGGAKFRTMESLEAEMLSPQKDQVKSNEGADDGKEGKEEKSKAEVKAEDVKETVIVAATVDTKEAAGEGTSTEEAQAHTVEYPDPITELMNPGGHPGGYGMQQQHQPLHHHQMPYHQPLHYGGGGRPFHHNPPPHPMHSYPGYPYPPPPPSGGGGPMMHHHSSYHNHPHHQHHHPQQHYDQHHQQPLPTDNRGYTTIQARVPHHLGPGNTMLVHGMSVPVPEGLPPGAIIPVMIPASVVGMQHPHHAGHHTDQHHHPHQHPADHQYGQNYYYPQHSMQNTHQQHPSHHHPHNNSMMMGYQQPYMSSSVQNQHQPQHQQKSGQQPQRVQQQPPNQEQPNSNSWAAKVKNTVASPSPAHSSLKEVKKRTLEKIKVPLSKVTATGGGAVSGAATISAKAPAKGEVTATSSGGAPKGAVPGGGPAKGINISSDGTAKGTKGSVNVGGGSKANKTKTERSQLKGFNNKEKNGMVAPPPNKKFVKKQHPQVGNGNGGATKDKCGARKDKK
mmetsp:Transcript_43736/g.92973  ORF Transcript_43736/g.92973 Transcript_43736/m.92973 type:complete len:825 (-) Transcript_43736:187-2661(-)